ncbi:hypothetical protein AVEN_247769-1 [Araneus ventricosus]|uniref:Uncharacterized protein n=1 Tax=Araneus ventricosus TaxID=182803 RepID=A0A4Y2NS70_ARAVE|nr:hypothetical protein AVEN_247769-1 [Araneus ventricosus]
MSGVERKRNVLNVKQKLEILQNLDNGESASTDAEDVLNEGNTISHSAALQSVETLLDHMGQRGFDNGDITVEKSHSFDIEMTVKTLHCFITAILASPPQFGEEKVWDMANRSSFLLAASEYLRRLDENKTKQGGITLFTNFFDGGIVCGGRSLIKVV